MVSKLLAFGLTVFASPGVSLGLKLDEKEIETQASEVEEVEGGPSWSVKEYVLEHNPEIREREMKLAEEKEAKRALERAKRKERIEHLLPHGDKDSFKQFQENVKEFGVLQMQKAKAALDQRKAEQKQMKAEAKFREKVLASKAAKQLAQDRRVEADMERKARYVQKVAATQRRNEEHAETKRIRAEAERLHEQAKAEREMMHLKRAGHGHYVRSPPGRDCPQGWTVVSTEKECRMAALALDSKDDVALTRAWTDRPAGCFWHVVNGHVAFNTGDGALSIVDERVCGKVDGAQEAVSVKQEEKAVKDAEERLQKKLSRDEHMAKVQLNERLHRKL